MTPETNLPQNRMIRTAYRYRTSFETSLFRTLFRRPGTLALILCLGSGIGCQMDSAFAPVPNAENAVWLLRLNYHAIQLSLQPPYNTVQLDPVPRTVEGALWMPSASSPAEAEAILAASPAVYTSTDSSKVLVSRTGLVTARAIQIGTVYVIARRQIGQVTRVDSAIVRVADVTTPPVLGTFQIRPAVGDSTKIAVGQNKSLAITIQDTGSVPMSGYPIYLSSANLRVAQISNKWAASKAVTTVDVGDVLIRSDTWIYGVARTDSFTLTVGYPTRLTLPIYLGGGGGALGRISGSPSRTIGPGGVVHWLNATGQKARDVLAGFPAARQGVPIDIVFDDSLAPLPALTPAQNSGGGNMHAIPGDTTLSDAVRIRYRRFVTPGRYPFHVIPTGETGTIIVKEL